MPDFLLYIGTSIALIFVIEGLLYALFPQALKKMFALVLETKPEDLRVYGVIMAFAGFLIVFFLSRF